MSIDIKKNIYTDSKHFLLIYYKTNYPVWNCNIPIEVNRLADCFTPINSFDNLMQIKKYITYNVFLNLCKEVNIYCMQQLKVLVGIDGKYVKNSINKYSINNSGAPIKDNYYYYFMENVIHLEEFIEASILKDIEDKIKLYNMKLNV